MRIVKETQTQFGQVDIAKIKLDLRSRDEIPKLLLGLQHIYSDPVLREQVFTILRTIVPPQTAADNGRPGMELWKILVFGVLRLNGNCDYDHLQELANNHQTIREMLGHGAFDAAARYALQTLKDNVSLLTPARLDQINQVVVRAGYAALKKNLDAGLRGQCDSFVVETGVHFPTDLNLLLDCVRKILVLLRREYAVRGLNGWRQSLHHYRKIKQLYRQAQRLKRSSAQDPEKKAAREQVIRAAVAEYLQVVQSLLSRVAAALPAVPVDVLPNGETKPAAAVTTIRGFKAQAERLIGQIRRRVLHGEVIAHEEKIFSVFEEHTEWISKGKAGVPQELGVRVCLVVGEQQFILHHRVMAGETDDQVAVPITTDTQARFPEFNRCSYDAGCYSPSNRQILRDLLAEVIMPKKGRLSAAEQAAVNTPEYRDGRRRHSAVEAAINGLEQGGLDCCPDHGLPGFERYVALAVVARNLHTLGAVIQHQAGVRQRRHEGMRRAHARRRALQCV